MTLSPAEGAEATVTIEGSGMMVKSMSVSQETASDGSIHIMVEAAVDLDPMPAPALAGDTEILVPGLSSNPTPITPDEDDEDEDDTTSGTGSNATRSSDDEGEESGTTESEDMTGLREDEMEEATITLDPDSGVAGTNVDIEGENFVANESIMVSFDGTNLSTGTINVGSDGEFSTTVTVPDDAPAGEHDLTASDSAGTEATETFTVEGDSEEDAADTLGELGSNTTESIQDALSGNNTQ
ncbi:hypothetical protein [Candidatus Nitrososphaera sp. FF02]|uniref:hypothetical protein n=1 Tax=Candidatus Nitrososphaera sp. FF02 TaxID=3398226 RepID=UPI0039EB18A2